MNKRRKWLMVEDVVCTELEIDNELLYYAFTTSLSFVTYEL
jgi:hypothetical protein